MSNNIHRQDGFSPDGEIYYRDVVEAKRSGDVDRVTELSLWHVLQETEGASIVIIGAGSPDAVSVENATASRLLKQDLKSNGHHVFRLAALWRTHEQSADAATRTSAYTASGISKKLIVKLARKYAQQAAVFIDAGADGQVVLFSSDGKERVVGNFSPEEVARAYSQACGGKFRFIGWELRPGTLAEALVDDHRRVFFSA